MVKLAFYLEARPTPSRLMSWLSPVLAVLLTVICGALLFVALGHDPLAGLGVFFVEPLRDLHGWSELAIKVAPLLLIAVGLAMCFRANVYNIGAEGQLTLGAICGGAAALYLTRATVPTAARSLPCRCWPAWPAAWRGRRLRPGCATVSTPAKSWSR